MEWVLEGWQGKELKGEGERVEEREGRWEGGRWPRREDEGGWRRVEGWWSRNGRVEQGE